MGTDSKGEEQRLKETGVGLDRHWLIKDLKGSVYNAIKEQQESEQQGNVD